MKISQFCNVNKLVYITQTRFFKIEAARRATQTKWEIVNFKKKAARRATQTKWEIVNFKKKAARRATQTKWEIMY